MSTDFANGGIPKTMQELKEYCERNDFTPSKTRFFIDYDYTGAKAFGIYKDETTGEFVVYKNKADGTRAVRYRGTDEEFAVVELYDRLQSEIANQKLRYAADMAERERNKYENEDAYNSIRNFNIDDYPVQGGYFNLDDYSDNGGHRGRKEADPLGTVIGIIAIIISIIMGLAGMGGGGGGYSSGYRSSYSSSYDYDSGWSSSSWDSGYTDWDSDW